VPRLRLAVALLVPEPARREIDGLRRALGDPQLGVVAPHVTLVPPINVAAADLDEALTLVRAGAACLSDGLVLELGPVATFAPDNPVLYLAVRPVEALSEARTALRRGVFDRADAYPFVPHVTLDIEAAPERLEAGLIALASYSTTTAAGPVTLLQEQRDDQRGRHWVPIADAVCGAPLVVGRGGLELELTSGTLVDPAAAVLWAGAEAPAGGEWGDLVITARRERRPVGLATGRRRRKVLALTGLVVDPAERGLGVGRALVARCASEAAAAGAERMVASRSLPDDTLALLAHLGWSAGRARLGRNL
jgi:2'-5' RNA ligase